MKKNQKNVQHWCKHQVSTKSLPSYSTLPSVTKWVFGSTVWTETPNWPSKKSEEHRTKVWSLYGPLPKLFFIVHLSYKSMLNQSHGHTLLGMGECFSYIVTIWVRSLFCHLLHESPSRQFYKVNQKSSIHG
jgi:hypothetical protein